MPKTEKLVVTKQYLEARKRWINILKSGETLAVQFAPPVTDSQRRIDQFISENEKEFLFLELNPLNPENEELIDFERNVLSQVNQSQKSKTIPDFESLISFLHKNKKQLILTIQNGSLLFTPQGKSYFPTLQKTILKYAPTITCLLIFDVDITHPDGANLTRDYHILFQKIDYYPLYSSVDILIFIDYLCKKWKIDVNLKTKKEIVEKCGGYLWLIKEAVRQIRDVGSWNSNSEAFEYKLQTIANSLKESEYLTITKIISKSRGLDETQIHSLKYLQKIGLLDKNNRLTVSLLKNAILKIGISKRKLVLIKDKIFLNQVPVSKFFSQKEFRIIKLLLSREGETVTRDEIADVIWPMAVEENFSEWAIDQLIKRLRNRLTELLIPKTVLRSVRGKGYCYVQY